MSESLKNEAEDYATSKYPPCFMKINGEFSTDVNFPRRKSAEEHFIAGHQSAERKSAAKDDRLLEAQLALDDCIDELRKTREMVRELVKIAPEHLDLCDVYDAEPCNCLDVHPLTRFKEEIERLGREQNGASSTKLMRETE